MAEEKKKSLKIFFHVLDGIGHLNACIGLAQALSNRGHEIFFLISSNVADSVDKYGFKKIVLELSKKKDLSKENESSEHPLSSMLDMLEEFKKSGIFSGKSSLEKIDNFKDDGQSLHYRMYEQVKDVHSQISNSIEKEQPDFIILDHFLVAPCILFGKIPWAISYSCNPLIFYNSLDLPPPMSGYPTNDRSLWQEFRDKKDKSKSKNIFKKLQNVLNNDFGFPEYIANPAHYFIKSPYLNFYGYPEELDYTDIVTIPENTIRLDAFCRDSTESFELPELFKCKIQPGDKLVYFSMGSMGGIDYELMQRIVNVLAKTSHKYIVSMGPLHEKYQLADNMWGQVFLPQTKVLPLVDMAITHGGNNTVTECMTFGKPMLILPLFADQYDNAQRVLEKGFGYRLDAHSFDETEMITTIDKILNDDQMLNKCRAAAERIRLSDSKTKACIAIEQLVAKMSSN